jgi:hypothetical protein
VASRCYIPEDSIFHDHRCENLRSYNIKICLKEIRLEDVDWIQIAEDRIQ